MTRLDFLLNLLVLLAVLFLSLAVTRCVYAAEVRGTATATIVTLPEPPTQPTPGRDFE